MSDQTEKDQPRHAVVVFKENLNKLVGAGELALPSNVTPEAFKNAVIVAVQDNPKILACEKSSVFKSIRKLAAAGLVPDGREAALVPFRTKVNGSYVDVCQAMPMVFGLIKMARRSNEVSDIRAHIVYQREVDEWKFSYVIGDREELTHNPILFGDKGPAVAAYAIAVLKDGSIIREFMSASEIDVVRRAGSSQRSYNDGKSKVANEPVGIWRDWWDQMWKKTVIRRLCKRLDLSSEDMRRLLVDEDDVGVVRDVTPEERPLTPLQRKVAAARGALTNPTQEEVAQEDQEDQEDLVPAEVTDAEIVDPENPPLDEVDLDNAFPGAAEFTEGAKAFAEGHPLSSCPYDMVTDKVKAIDWLGGFNKAKMAGE